MPERNEEDPVLAEVRQVRDALAARHRNDVASFFAELRKHQAAFGRQLVSPPSEPAHPASPSGESAA